MAGEPQAERLIESRRAYEGRILNLRLDSVELPSGHRSLREVVEHDEVVAIVPVDANGDVLLVRQYRQAVGKALLEVPAGGVDKGEDLLDAAQRELQEETGYRAESLERLGGFYVSPGYCTEYIHLYLACGLSESSLDADEDEDIVLERLPLDGAIELIGSGEIQDAKSISGLLLVRSAFDASG
ncbi:MAG TPA: NUDIX hydrolase [Dehalococcoidia bacterium]|nr:NUDIX hydrolase [Dehalococcoidia bacterium]